MKRKATIAILTPHIGLPCETYTKNHTQRLLPRHTVTVSLRWPWPGKKSWKPAGPELILPMQFFTKTNLTTGLRGEFGPFAPHIPRTARFLRAHGVTHILAETLDFGVHWLPLAEAMGISYFARAHGRDSTLPQICEELRGLYQRFNRSDGVIAVSQAIKNSLSQWNIKKRKISVVHNGVDVPDTFSLRGPRRTVEFLTVGRMIRKKNPELLIRAFEEAALIEPAIRLTWAGTGPCAQKMGRYVRQSRILSDRVRILGELPNARVRALMRKSDVLIHPSSTDPVTGDQEGMPLAILEAMAEGLPVVSTFHSGIPEAVLHEKTGLLSRENDRQGLTENILAFTDRERRISYGRAAWKRAQENFSWEHERAGILRAMGISQQS